MHMRRCTQPSAKRLQIGALLLVTPVLGLLACQPQPTPDEPSSPASGGSSGSSSSSGTGGASSSGQGGSQSGTGGASASGTGGSSTTASGGSTGSGSGGATGSGSGGALGSDPDSTNKPDAGGASDTAAPTDPPPTTPGGPAATTSEACGKGMPAPMDGIHMIMAANMPRKFFLRVPNDYDGKTAYPMVFAFHGAGNKDATWFDTNTGFRAAHEAKAVMLFPESLTSGGNHTWMTASQHPANLAFVDAMIEWTKKNICINPSRIFSTGQSSGAYFSQTLACQRGDVIRAVATNSGGERYFENCKGNPGVMISYGKGDEQSHITAAGKATTFWIARNGCKADGPMPVDPSPCVKYQGCKEGSPLVVCAHGGGHPWPGYANNGFWNFFETFK
jgi:polyhydroxybutyrate depolymerase